MLNMLWRNMKWRFQNPISIIITILQPLIWLVLYSALAGQSMQNMGISNYTAFILPGIIVLVTLAACSSGGILNFIMKTNGSYYRILMAPVSRLSIILSQMMESILVAFLEAGILCMVSLVFSVTIASGIAGIALMMLLIFMTALFMSGLTYAISLCLPNEVVYETIMNAVILPIFFLSPALFPLESMSSGWKTIVMLNPFTHIIKALRDLILEETIVLENMMPIILLFAVMCYGSFSLATWSLKKQTAH